MDFSSKIQSWYLKTRDNWIWVFIFFILNLGLPMVLPKIKFKVLLSLLNYKIPVWSLVLSLILVSVFYKIYRIATGQGELKILVARYGMDSTFLDITDKLNQAIINNKLKIVLSNNIAGDPIPGKVKKGTLEYRLGNKKITKEYIEGNVIDLP